MAKSEGLLSLDLVVDATVIDILWDALETKRYPKGLKEALLGRVRELEARHALKSRRYNHAA